MGRWFLRLNGEHREEVPGSQHRHSQGRLHTPVVHAGPNSKTPLPTQAIFQVQDRATLATLRRLGFRYNERFAGEE
jgi:hypothetical protein